MRTQIMNIALLITLVLIGSFSYHEATRILDEDEQELMNREHLLLPSFQRGTVRPPAPNSCTFIPGNGGSPCTFNEKNFAGHSMGVSPPPPPPPPPLPRAYPGYDVSFGVATPHES
ncbi:hypothetical protein LIER_40232 [Lithospermum erythrorhizon]|uniref:Uncharacterized protein n=1 Tax=Lithospermum erythrorhizon TaxID=34254 RepID=A0AAV3QX57_LITER